MSVDEVLQDLSWRSSSAWAKKALASFRVSLALRNSLFSRSSFLTRCASLIVLPWRTPASISERLTQSCRVLGTQTTLPAGLLSSGGDSAMVCHDHVKFCSQA